MKKLIFILMMLSIATPAIAQKITVRGEWYENCGADACEPNALVRIIYDLNDALKPDPCEVRAFALDFEVHDNNGYVAAFNNVSEDYWVYPGSIDIYGQDDYDQGEPDAVPGSPGALPGLGTAWVTTEQGSLYSPDDESHPDPPDPCAMLLELIVGGDQCTKVKLTISTNTTRGGVVLKDMPGFDTTPILDLEEVVGIIIPGRGDCSDRSGQGPPDGTVDIGDITKVVNEMLTVYGGYDPCQVYDINMPACWGGLADVSDISGQGPPDDNVDIGDVTAMVNALISDPRSSGAPFYDLGGCMNW